MAGSGFDWHEPTYLPSGFALRRQITGEGVVGLGRDPHQVGLVYTVGWDREALMYPLLVFVRPDGGAELACTERRPGLPIDLGMPAVNALYHDGWWQLNPNRDLEPDRIVAWDASTVHSISVTYNAIQFAVRAARHATSLAATVSLPELTKISRSML